MTVTLGWAFVSFGGVHHGSRAALHLLLGGGLGLAMALPTSTLSRAGSVLPLARSAALLLGAVGVGLLILPRPVLRWIAPGTVEASPDRSWSTLSLDPAATLGELSHLLLVVGIAVLVAVWSVARWRRHRIEQALIGGGIVVASVATLHAATGATALFGVVDTWVTPPDRFFAPFLDDNHLAASLLMPLPLLLAHALSGGSLSGRITAGAGVLGSVGLIGWTGSAGALGIAALALLATAAALGRLPWWVPPGVASLGLVALLAGDGLIEHGRLPMWRAAVHLASRHWLAGSGGGTFLHAIEPYRTDRDFVSWDHAHNDLVEWIAETGALGLVALALAIRSLWQGSWRSPDRAGLIGLGLASLGLHALIEFPLQIPALAMAAAAVIGALIGVFRPTIPTDGGRLRWGLGLLIAAQLLASGWEIRSAVEQQSVTTILARGEGAAVAAERLAVVAPWRPERQLHRAWGLEARGEGASAVAVAEQIVADHPSDPQALRLASQLLARHGRGELALPVAERAVSRAPADWRTWAARALALEEVDPERAAGGWIDAIAHGAPPRLVARGWRHLPVGLPWVQATEGLPPRYAAAMARELRRLGDQQAAILAYEQAMLADPSRVDPGHLWLLLEEGREAEVDALLEQALSLHPADPRFLRPLAELRERQGAHGRASEAWLQLSRHDASSQVRAVRERAVADGPEAALALVAQLELELGEAGLQPTTRLEQARLLLQQDQGPVCVRELMRSGVLELDRHRAAAAALLEACRRGS